MQGSTPARAWFGLAVSIALFGCSSGSAGAAKAPVPSAQATISSGTAAAVVAEGAVAPDFVGPADDGTNIALSGLRGRTVVLWFYTRDETPTSIREALDFRDVSAQLRERGVVVVGVSTDDVSAHRKFVEKHKLPFRVVSDPKGTIARAYGVPVEYGVADRQTFIIRPDGVVKKIYRTVEIEKHVADVVANVR